MKILIILALSLSCASCFEKPDRYFWYPISLMQVNCGNSFAGKVYVMTNSVGWRSNPYFLDVSDKQEIVLGLNCVLKKIRSLPVHNRKKGVNIEDQLTHEQQAYMIDGFNQHN